MDGWWTRTPNPSSGFLRTFAVDYSAGVPSYESESIPKQQDLTLAILSMENLGLTVNMMP